jgi:hypothetical protein
VRQAFDVYEMGITKCSDLHSEEQLSSARIEGGVLTETITDREQFLQRSWVMNGVWRKVQVIPLRDFLQPESPNPVAPFASRWG